MYTAFDGFDIPFEHRPTRAQGVRPRFQVIRVPGKNGSVQYHMHDDTATVAFLYGWKYDLPPLGLKAAAIAVPGKAVSASRAETS
jgi:hypothetical protein